MISIHQQRRKAWLAILLVTLLITSLIGGCSPSPAAVAEREIQSRLGEDAKTIVVTIKNGQAKLTGAVALRSTKRIASEIALSLSGIGSVDNQISVPARQKLEGLYMDAVDAEVERNVRYVLLRRVGPDVVATLHIVAMEGIVSVRGRVASNRLRRRIVMVAGDVEDVQRVIDLVTVGDETASAPER